MNEPDPGFDPWLDARLRNVPLPVNFLARLEQIGNAETQQIDRALRDVPLPDGLLERLRLISRQPRVCAAAAPFRNGGGSLVGDRIIGLRAAGSAAACGPGR